MMRLREMNLADMDAIMRIEQGVHAHPWTRGNFTDALKSDCVCKVYEAKLGSNSISKVKQGGDERTTQTVQLARLGVSEDANAVSPMKLDWNEMLGYVVLMPAVDEAQLLNISIAAEQQRKGLGRKLLIEIMEIARGMNMRRMLLEVRPSNVAALGLYRDAGFSQIGLRRGYYPAAAPARGTPKATQGFSHPEGVGNLLSAKADAELTPPVGSPSGCENLCEAPLLTPVKGTPPDTRPMGGLGAGSDPSAANEREDAIVMECVL